VTVGFTAGIAVIFLASQLKELGGLHLSAAEPGPLLPKLAALAGALPTLNPLALGLGSAALIFVQRAFLPSWPGMLIAVIMAALLAAVLHMPVETIGSRFGELPHGLPRPALPHMTYARLIQLLPVALSFTLLGGIESLLSAKVADSMTGRKHRSNMELVAQGVANVAAALFGGISVTGTIARTATNIRAGARSPLSGMMHALFVLLFMMVAAPLASFIPLAALAGVLTVVCWNMADKGELAALLRHWPSALVLLVTFGLTLLRDLTTGILAGCVLAAILAFIRPGTRPFMAEAIENGHNRCVGLAARSGPAAFLPLLLWRGDALCVWPTGGVTL
jgi:SulP family sulfate permease